MGGDNIITDITFNSSDYVMDSRPIRVPWMVIIGQVWLMKFLL